MNTAIADYFDVWTFAKADGKSSYFGRPWTGPGRPPPEGSAG